MEQFTITFDLSNEIDAKVYYVVKNLSRYYKKFYNLNNLSDSEALIRYIHDVGNSLLDCEERKEKCERVLEGYSRKHAHL